MTDDDGCHEAPASAASVQRLSLLLLLLAACLCALPSSSCCCCCCCLCSTLRARQPGRRGIGDKGGQAQLLQVPLSVDACHAAKHTLLVARCRQLAPGQQRLPQRRLDLPAQPEMRQHASGSLGGSAPGRQRRPQQPALAVLAGCLILPVPGCKTSSRRQQLAAASTC